MDDRYLKALERNLAELQKAILIRTTLLAIEEHEYTASQVIRVVNDALYTAYIAHAIKVFDRDSKSASYWYICRVDSGSVNRVAKCLRISLDGLEVISDKLKIIRNGTAFHIDKRSVVDPSIVWGEADLTGIELSDAIDNLWFVLSKIQEELGGEVPSLLDYEKVDALEALKAISKLYLAKLKLEGTENQTV